MSRLPRGEAILGRALAGESFTSTLETDGATFDVWCEPHRGHDGEISGVIGVAYDVTALKRVEQLLNQANATLEERVLERTDELEEAHERLLRSEKLSAVGQLAGGLAHDLRNPLGGINLAAYYLQSWSKRNDVAQSNPRVGEFLGIIEKEVQHANQIISDLLEYARVKTVVLSPTRLPDLVESVLTPLAERENVRIVRQFDPSVPRVLADGEQLVRVFANLVGNGVEAMPEGGELHIGVRAVGDAAEVSFRDTGVGIAQADLKRVFDPLFTTKVKGTGLGLSVCQDIVTKHNGTLTVTSEPGQGTIFTVRLPHGGATERGRDA